MFLDTFWQIVIDRLVLPLFFLVSFLTYIYTHAHYGGESLKMT